MAHRSWRYHSQAYQSPSLEFPPRAYSRIIQPWQNRGYEANPNSDEHYSTLECGKTKAFINNIECFGEQVYRSIGGCGHDGDKEHDGLREEQVYRSPQHRLYKGFEGWYVVMMLDRQASEFMLLLQFPCELHEYLIWPTFANARQQESDGRRSN